MVVSHMVTINGLRHWTLFPFGPSAEKFSAEPEALRATYDSNVVRVGYSKSLLRTMITLVSVVACNTML